MNLQLDPGAVALFLSMLKFIRLSLEFLGYFFHMSTRPLAVQKVHSVFLCGHFHGIFECVIGDVSRWFVYVLTRHKSFKIVCSWCSWCWYPWLKFNVIPQ